MTAPNDAGAGNGDAGNSTTPSGDGTAAFAPITSQADLDRILGERLARQRAQFAGFDELKAKAAKFDEHEAKNKTELEKLTETAKANEARAAAAELALIKRDAAEAAGLPKSWADRLKGATKEELEADAKELAKDLPAPTTSPGTVRPVADLRPGALPAAAGTAGAFDADKWIRSQAGVA